MQTTRLDTQACPPCKLLEHQPHTAHKQHRVYVLALLHALHKLQLPPRPAMRPSCARSLLEGKTGVAQITRFDASDFPTTFAAQIKDFDNEGCVL